MSKQLPAERIHQSIARQLGTAILSGEYPPGKTFGNEVDASAALGISRTAYREALKLLAAKGFLESRPKAGTRVRPRSAWNMLDPDVLFWAFSANEPDRQFVRDLFELREIIEPVAAGLAAQRRSENHLEAMAQALELMRTHGLASEAGQQGDNAFHRLILDATGNATLVSLGESIGAAVQWTTHFKQSRHKMPRDPHADHVAVFEAIAKGDADRARAAMTDLLRLALRDMRG